eukprot:5198413-Prymnesium_polylepis.1
MKQAQTRQAELERELLSDKTRAMTAPKVSASKKGGGGGGFGKQAGARSAAERETDLRVETLRSDGVCYVPGVLKPESVETLYACVVDELSKSYAAVERDPSSSIGRFNVPVETHDPQRRARAAAAAAARSRRSDPRPRPPPTAARGYLLLPMRDEQSVIDGVTNGRVAASRPSHHEGHAPQPRTHGLRPLWGRSSYDQHPCARSPIVSSLRELVSKGTKLGELFGAMCGGDAAELYDLVALRTEAGAARQPIHYDTPYQKARGRAALVGEREMLAQLKRGPCARQRE